MTYTEHISLADDAIRLAESHTYPDMARTQARVAISHGQSAWQRADNIAQRARARAIQISGQNVLDTVPADR